jgi:hypothetical protein
MVKQGAGNVLLRLTNRHFAVWTSKFFKQSEPPESDKQQLSCNMMSCITWELIQLYIEHVMYISVSSDDLSSSYTARFEPDIS